MKIKSKSQCFELACKLSELGGKTPVGNDGIAQGHLEFNSITFAGSEKFSIVSIDALYPPENLDLPSNILVCSSHTHQAPMIDRGKPLLGNFSEAYLDRLKGFLNSPQDRSINSRSLKLRCVRYKADVSIYRRADYSTSVIERSMNFLRRSIKSAWPNSALAIDQNIYIFLFESEEHTEFAFIYYANHPVSRHDKKNYLF